MIAFLLLAALVAAYLYYTRKRKTARTTQEVVGATVISQDGLIQDQDGNVFRTVIEVEPINLDTASETEHKNVWVNFVAMINTLGVSYKLIMRSEFFEMRDYTDDLQKRLSVLDLPQALQQSGEATRSYLANSTEEAKIRDFRGFLILQYNPVQTAQAGIQTGVGGLDRLIGKAGETTKVKMSDAEKRDLAQQMLMDAAGIVYGFCEQVGMRYQLLNKAGALNVTYQMLQRDMSPYARMSDAIEQNSFYPMKQSLTVDHV